MPALRHLGRTAHRCHARAWHPRENGSQTTQPDVPGLPHHLVREHRWRDDVVTLGEVDADWVAQVTEGIYRRPWPAQANRLLLEGGHDLIFSLGQVVPHEVIGMANYNKNIFVGTGGSAGIHESHYLSALYGMERIMGRAATPLRKVLNEASDRFCKGMPIVYALTVVESLAVARSVVAVFGSAMTMTCFGEPRIGCPGQLFSA